MAETDNDSVFTGLMDPKFVQKDLSKIPQLHDMSVADSFTFYTTKDRESGIKVFCELWGRIILIRQNSKKPIAGFMDISYARIKVYSQAGERRIRFIKNKKYEELFNEDETVLHRWHRELAIVCVYSNFRNEYDIQTMLGKGNFATVYLMEERSTKKKFAAKVFDKLLINADKFEKVVCCHLEMFPP